MLGGNARAALAGLFPGVKNEYGAGRTSSHYDELTETAEDSRSAEISQKLPPGTLPVLSRAPRPKGHRDE